MALIACATVLVRAGVGWAVADRRRDGRRRSLVAFVGVTRIYLGAHYLTDVLGGIALAAGDLVDCWRVRAIRRDAFATMSAE